MQHAVGGHDPLKRILGDLTSADRAKIDAIVMYARENLGAAQEIVRIVVDHIRQCQLQYKLAAFYVLDAILKNVREFIPYFEPFLAETFVSTFQLISSHIPALAPQYVKLFRTWIQFACVAPYILRSIEARLNWPEGGPPMQDTKPAVPVPGLGMPQHLSQLQPSMHQAQQQPPLQFQAVPHSSLQALIAQAGAGVGIGYGVMPGMHAMQAQMTHGMQQPHMMSMSAQPQPSLYGQVQAPYGAPPPSAAVRPHPPPIAPVPGGSGGGMPVANGNPQLPALSSFESLLSRFLSTAKKVDEVYAAIREKRTRTKPKHRLARAWFASLAEWQDAGPCFARGLAETDEKSLVPFVDREQFFFETSPESGKKDHPSSSKRNSPEPDSHAGDLSIRAQEDEQVVCRICGELIQVGYNDDIEDFVFSDAVRDGEDNVVHANCLASQNGPAKRRKVL
eukprot:ANDGO_04548.mRNA.1 Polyadenylation and cleavage factor homolog 4